MKEKLAISELIEKDKGKAYDEYCKKILSNKQILAHIIKRCVLEFADVPLQEIPSYIESSPMINATLSGNDKIIGMNTEDETIAGAMIRYDILFEVTLPEESKEGTKEKIGLFINIEAQVKDDPGYSLVRRALYYCSRLIARQKNSPGGFEKSKLDDIKKVYSIFLCINHPEQKDDVINMYSIKESSLSDKVWEEKADNYDLMTAIMVYPGKDYDYNDQDHSLQELLNILFMSKLSAEERKRQLTENYGIQMTKEIESEVEDMCNLSQGIKAEGKAEGIAEGIIKTTVDHVEALLATGNFDVDSAMEMLKVADDLRPEIKKAMNKKEKK